MPDITPTAQPVEPTSYLGVPPPGAIRRLGLGRIESMALSPDGMRLAVGTSVGLYLYDALSFELLWFHPSRDDFVGGLSFSLGGRLVAGHEGGRVFVWEVASGQVMFDQPVEARIGPVLISPDNEKVIVQGRVVHMWSLKTGEELGVYDNPSPPGIPIGLSPTGDTIAYQTGDLETGLLNLRDQSVHVLDGDRGYTFVFSPDGRLLASESDEKHQITVWDVKARTQVSTIQDDDRITPMAFTADGGLLLALSGRDGFDVWDVAAGDLASSITGIETEGWLSMISPRGEIFDPDTERVRVYSLETGQLDRVLAGFTSQFIESLTVLPNGGQIMFGRSREISIWDTQTGQPQTEIPIESGSDWVLSPDGRMLAINEFSRDVSVWDMVGGEPILTIEGIQDVFYTVSGVAFALDGQTLAVGHGADGIDLIEIDSGQVLRRFPDLELDRRGRFSVDGSSFLAWSRGVPGVWDIETGRLIYALPVGSNTRPRFDISPDQQAVAVYTNAGFEGRIEVIDIDSQEVLWSVSYAEERADVRHLLYSPDGSLLAVGRLDGSIDFLDAQTGDEIVRYQHVGLSDLVFAPDGLWLASSSDDGTVILWDVPY